MSAIVVSRDDMQVDLLLAEGLVDSGYFKDLHKASEAVVKILAGRENGLGPIESQRAFHAINGKVDWTADALAARLKAHPRYDYRVALLTDQECELVFYEAGAEVGRSSFTEADRDRAGLGVGGNSPSAWQRFPRNMLFARALTNGVGWFTPDLSFGFAAPAPVGFVEFPGGSGADFAAWIRAQTSEVVVEEAEPEGKPAELVSRETVETASPVVRDAEELVDAATATTDPSAVLRGVAARTRQKTDDAEEAPN